MLWPYFLVLNRLSWVMSIAHPSNRKRNSAIQSVPAPQLCLQTTIITWTKMTIRLTTNPFLFRVPRRRLNSYRSVCVNNNFQWIWLQGIWIKQHILKFQIFQVSQKQTLDPVIAVESEIMWRTKSVEIWKTSQKIPLVDVHILEL